MALFKPLRGNRSTLDAQALHDGYAYFCTDDGSFHIDYVDADGNLQRKQVNQGDLEALGYKIDNLPQADWNQNDPTAKDYIKNRPFYLSDLIELCNGQYTSIPFEDYGYAQMAVLPYNKWFGDIFNQEEPVNIKISVNGTFYDLTTMFLSDISLHLAGNLAMLNVIFGAEVFPVDPEAPDFVVGFSSDMAVLSSDFIQENTYEVAAFVVDTMGDQHYVQIDDSFIPDTIAREYQIDNLSYDVNDKINNLSSNINTKLTTELDKKLDKTGGTITGSLTVKNGINAPLSRLVVNDGSAIYGLKLEGDTYRLGKGTVNSYNELTFNTGEGSPVALRDDNAAFTTGHCIIWDAASNKLVDSGGEALLNSNDINSEFFDSLY